MSRLVVLIYPTSRTILHITLAQYAVVQLTFTSITAVLNYSSYSREEDDYEQSVSHEKALASGQYCWEEPLQ